MGWIERLAGGLAVSLLIAGPAPAEDYPSRPIKLITSFPAGGASDILGRSVGQKLSEAFNQPLVLDNRAGAGGTLGADIAAKAPPDGYTLFMGAGAHALAPSIYAKLGYDFIRDFAPISLIAKGTYLLLLHPSVPAGSVAELVALAKAKPGQLNFATPGTGAPPHLAGELFNTMAGVKLVHVPYRGDTQALADLVAGQVQIGFIADGMLPEAALPYALFPLAALAFRTLGHRRQIP